MTIFVIWISYEADLFTEEILHHIVESSSSTFHQCQLLTVITYFFFESDLMAFNSKSVMKYLYLSKINDGSSNDLFCSSISVCLEISGFSGALPIEVDDSSTRRLLLTSASACANWVDCYLLGVHHQTYNYYIKTNKLLYIAGQWPVRYRQIRKDVIEATSCFYMIVPWENSYQACSASDTWSDKSFTFSDRISDSLTRWTNYWC